MHGHDELVCRRHTFPTTAVDMVAVVGLAVCSSVEDTRGCPQSLTFSDDRLSPFIQSVAGARNRPGRCDVCKATIGALPARLALAPHESIVASMHSPLAPGEETQSSSQPFLHAHVVIATALRPKGLAPAANDRAFKAGASPTGKI